MSSQRTEVLLVTPLPPMKTGLATYAVRVLENTVDFIDWVVACPQRPDMSLLPEGPQYLRLDELESRRPPDARIFQLGNSLHCFPVLRALYRMRGTTVFHETVLHHMIRQSCIERDMMDEYAGELRFCYGPGAEKIGKLLSKRVSEKEYDDLQKRYPLLGRALNASTSAACLNEYAADQIRNAFAPETFAVIGHPLSPLPVFEKVHAPFSPCLGMVGSYHPGRNLDKTMAAVRILRDKGMSGAGLLLLGEGYPEDTPEWVMRAGRLPEPEYQAMIRTMDVVTDLRHPTCGETSGSLLEVMRAGIPSVVSASGAFLHIPSDAVMRVPVESTEEAVAEACRMLILDDDLRLSMSRAAEMYALSRGSVERLRKDWRKLTVMASAFSPVRPTSPKLRSLSPAWMDPPDGFERCLDTAPVTWKFRGEVRLKGPDGSMGGYVTVWGEGTVNGMPMSRNPEVMDFRGNELVMNGRGHVSNVYWN